MDPDPREEKLPRWAQESLKSLRAQVVAANKARDDARQEHGPTDSDTILDPYHPAGPIALPKGERVRFIVGDTPEGLVDRAWVDAQVARQTFRDGSTDRWLEVMAGDTLAVSPQSSNVIRIRVTDRY